MNDTGILAAMRTADAGWLEMKLVNYFGLDYIVEDGFAKVTFHYKLFAGKLYLISFKKD